MVIEILTKKKADGHFEKHLYEFAHITLRHGIWGWYDGLRVIYDEGIEPKVLRSLPIQILSGTVDGGEVKFVDGYKTFDVHERPYVITFIGDMYVMENGKTIDKF